MSRPANPWSRAFAALQNLSYALRELERALVALEQTAGPHPGENAALRVARRDNDGAASQGNGSA